MSARQKLYHPGFPCPRHQAHKLDCEAFCGLLDRADGACEMCRHPWDMALRGLRPYIDHDHASPIWAVRGLLCQSCNVNLARIEDGTRPAVDAATRYVANAWYRNEGLPTYLARAREWLSPDVRADREFLVWRGATPPSRYQRIQDQQEAWCLAFLADQQVLL